MTGAGASDRPARLGPYEILARLGQGGMGVVYRGRHVETGQEVAVKTVHVPYGSVLASLRSEIHALTRIRHPGIVRLVGEGIEAGLPWYAMELLEGRTLENRIGETWGAFARPGSHSSVPTAPTPFRAATEEILPPSDVSRTTAPVALQTAGSPPPAAGGRLQEMLVLIRRLCRPLTFIHSLGIVHRDLKPGNVFIRADGTPVLVDFGLVSLMTGAVGREALEVVAQMQGTLEYMSPEQIRLEVIDARSDLYALGCILYEVVTGRCPFLGRGKKELMARHQYEEPVPPSRLVTGVPPGLDALVLRLLAKRPRDRIGHADDVAAMLEQLGAGADEPEAPRAGEAAPRPHLYRSQLHGRESVLEGLSTRLSAISQGAAGGLVLVSGESGLGKTALLGAIGREATMRGVQVISGECTPISTPGSGDADVRGGPLHLFRTLLQNVADQCREGGREMADRVFAGRGKLLGAYEPSLRYLPGQDSQPEPPAVPAQAERLRILEAMVATLGALAAERPLLLILDDLQWADDLSLDVMVAIAEAFAPSGGALAQRPLMVVGAYRVEEAGAGLDDLVGRPGIERIALGRLDEPVLRQIMGEMLAMTSPPRGFIRVLARRSGGNPFFAAEHLRAAVDERVLYRERGRWRLVDGDTDEESLYEARLPSPRSLGELIARRLEGLTPGARALVDVASVLGREADTELLVAVAGVDHDSALGSIRQLLARQVLEEVRPGRLRFCHDKLREIASGIIAAGRRQALHAVTAAVMEAQSAGSAGVGVAYSELAHHFREAGNLEKAIDYFEKAGAQAQRSFANRDAATFFGEALALDQKAGCPTSALRRAGWERQLGNANLALGRLVESQNHLLASVALLGAPMPSSKLGLVWGLLREATRQLWSRLRPRRTATVLPADRDRLLEAARAYDLLMPVSYFVSGELPRILYATLRNLNLAERGGPSPELALAYANAQVTTGLVPLFRLADAYGRRLHETLEGISDPAVRSWSYVLAGSYACGVGRWQDALAWGARAQAIGEEVGFPRRIEEGLGVQGAAHNLRGDFGKGRDISHALWQSALRGDPQTQVWGAAGEAQNCLVLGELERGLVAAGRAEPCLAHNLGRPEKIICYGVLALAALRNGDKKRARESAGKALTAVTEGAPIAFYCITAYSCMAETLLELWKDAQISGDQAEAETLRRLAKQACGEVKRSARVFPVHRPRALELAGRYQQLIGRTGAAIRTWQRALGAAQGAGLAYEEGLISADLAQLSPDDARRADLVARSQACFAQTGAVYEAARVEAALGRAAAA